jgi:hypothetical protein
MTFSYRLSRLIPVDVTTFRGPSWTAGALAAVNTAGTPAA